MKEILNVAKKIRNKLISFIDEELKKNALKNKSFLIDSKSPNELSKKYQKFSDYRMQISETYNGNQMNNNNINVAVTYSSRNKKYEIWIENNEKFSSEQIERDIVKDIDIKAKKVIDVEKNNFNIILKDNKKRIIGDKKFSYKKKALFSSIEIPKKAIIIMEDNNNSDNISKKNIDKLDHDKNNRERNETICANKKRRLKVNYYENKLKKYCSTLIILKKKKQKKFKKNFTLKQENKQVIETPGFQKPKDSKDKTETKLHNSIKSQSKQQHKSRMREKEKLNKINEKKTHRRYRAQSIKDAHLLVNSLPKKLESPKKLIHQSSTIHADSKNKEIISQKIPRKEKDKNLEEINEVRKMISGGIKGKRRIFAEKSSFNWNNKMMLQMTNRFNNNEHNKIQTQLQQPTHPSNRIKFYKRANTLKGHNLFHFKGNVLKFKDN